MAGLLGVATGSLVSRAWRDGKSVFRNCATEKADVFICAISMFLALPFLFLAILIAQYSVNGSLVLIYFAIMSMCLNWSVNVDVLMYVVVANRRATALAIQTLVAHLFGDATSPYIIGVLSDWLREPDVSVARTFFALQTALYVPTFMLVIAGGFFLAASFFVERDRKEALFQMDGNNLHCRSLKLFLKSLQLRTTGITTILTIWKTLFWLPDLRNSSKASSRSQLRSCRGAKKHQSARPDGAWRNSNNRNNVRLSPRQMKIAMISSESSLTATTPKTMYSLTTTKVLSDSKEQHAEPVERRETKHLLCPMKLASGKCRSEDPETRTRCFESMLFL